MEVATRKSDNIFDLPVDVFPYIFRFLDTQDRIAFASACQLFRRICVDIMRVFRRIDLSRRPIFKMERGAINEFFRNTQVVRQITELNLSNSRVFNWQMDEQLEEFISICPHLEALHVINCEMSLRRLNRILQKPNKLTSLSWSLWDITAEDIRFIFKSIRSQSRQTSTMNSLLFRRNSMSLDVKSSDGICLKNIKHLHLELYPSKPHIQILEYLVFSCYKDIEELEICIWQVDEDYFTGQMIALLAYLTIPGFPRQFTFTGQFQHLHSLTVATLGNTLENVYSEELCNFISSVVRKKSRETKWRKLWIPPAIGFNILQDLIPEIQPHELQSVEEITVDVGEAENAVDDFKTSFQGIDDNTVRSLHLCQPSFEVNSIVELCDPISRVAGHALKFLSLSVHKLDTGKDVFLRTLFSNCLNITELDLLWCYFEKDICEPLSKLKHLTKVQLMQCAISSKYCKKTKVEISRANLLTFVENCKNITHLDVRSCPIDHLKHFSCRLADDDMLAFAKLSNLESLTLLDKSGIRKWLFLKSMSENCKYLTTLRIADICDDFMNSPIPILMQSAKFLKHLALNAYWLDLQSEAFWNLLSQAKNLERLCIRNVFDNERINIPVAVETIKSLPHLRVLHLHSVEDGINFHIEIYRMLEEENSDRRSFFELVTGYLHKKRQVFRKELPINRVELCNMTPILEIPRF